MKKIIILVIILVFSTSIYIVFIKRQESQPSTNDTTAPTQITLPRPSKQQETSQVSPTGELTFSWLVVRDSNALTLHSNLEDKLASSNVMQEKECLHLVNAGFYMPDETHIGLFVSEGEILSTSRKNSLFNGYFSISFDGTPNISKNPPVTPRVGLQTGPILLQDGKSVTLSLSKDKPSRRVVLATDRQKNIVFIVIYIKGFVFDGPNLEELPNLIEQLNESSSLELVDAINLDGGTASTFITDSVKLTELVKIGSYFCVKEGLILNP